MSMVIRVMSNCKVIKMKLTEFMSELVKSKSGYSSKRFSSLVLIFSSIFIPVISMSIGTPRGSIDESVLILSAQFLMAACGLLGFTVKENLSSTKSRLIKTNKKSEVKNEKFEPKPVNE